MGSGKKLKNKTCKTIYSFGEILWDRLPDKIIIGGATFNFTYRVNSLGDKGLIISSLGKDELGQKALDKISELGMDRRYIQWDEKRSTGTVDVFFDENNNPDYVINPGVAYDNIQISGELLEDVVSADCFYFGTLAQREKSSRQTLNQLLETANAAIKFYDVNLRKDCFNKTIIDNSLKLADICKLNEDEATQLGAMLNLSLKNIKTFSSELIEKYQLKYCLVTFAERGVYALTAGGEEAYEPGYKVTVIDPIGSGDAFSAGFMHKILRKANLQEACTYGNVLGALAATKPGATYPISPGDMDEFNSTEYKKSYMPEFSRIV